MDIMIRRFLFFWLLFVLTVVAADDTCPGLAECFCSKDRTSVNCEGKHFTSVPENIPSSAVKLYLRYNQITNLLPGSFAGLKKLESLWLSDNKMMTISPHAFSNLSSLVFLDLRSNKMRRVGNDALSDMPRLETLYMATNQLETIASGAFVGTSSIKYCYLQANRLTAIPDLGYQPYLQSIILEGNSIVNAVFPKSFASSKRLSAIVLSNNGIQHISDDTFLALANTDVQRLYISRNTIKTIASDAFSNFSSINSLKLGSNPLDSSALSTALAGLAGKDLNSLDISDINLSGILLNSTFSHLKNTTLKSLVMSSNKILVLPEKVFSQLNTLLMLDISNCEIQQTTDNAFAGLDKLSTLILNKNRLSSVPLNIPPSLLMLYMDNNLLTTINNHVFENLTSLLELRIRYNKLQTLMQDSFYGLYKLNKLSLYANNIATLPGALFSSLVRLISLDLAKNNLDKIQYTVGRLESLRSLIYLNLADNGCSYFQPDLFQPMESLRYLHLERNNLGPLIARDYGGEMFKGLKHLDELYLMDNTINDISDPSLQDLISLKLLNLTRNKLSGWGPNLFKLTCKLINLDLSNNIIATINSSNVQDMGNLRVLNLTGNPFNCNCDLRWFRDWINRTNVELANNASYKCNGPMEWRGKSLLSFNRRKINCNLFTMTTLLVVGAAAVCASVVIGYLVYMYRWKIRFRIYNIKRRGKLTRRIAAGGYGAIGQQDEEGYHAYVSCSEHADDRTWVLTYLLPWLDDSSIDTHANKFNGHFRIHYGEIDDVPGYGKFQNFEDSIMKSQRVIVVLSKHYRTGWNEFVLDQVSHMVIERELAEIVVVTLGAVPANKVPHRLRGTMKRHDFIAWEDNEEASELCKAELTKRIEQGFQRLRLHDE